MDVFDPQSMQRLLEGEVVRAASPHGAPARFSPLASEEVTVADVQCRPLGICEGGGTEIAQVERAPSHVGIADVLRRAALRALR